MATIFHPSAELKRRQSYTGLRAFDMGRDLRPVAELIADAFSTELDPGGQAALREMRILGHMGSLFGFLNRSTLDFSNGLGGFVWVEEGRVIGNVTVQKADSYGNRWQIANVAVDPAHRGRGIARQLMDKALDYAREMGGRWAVLQVRGGNQVALGLYERMGFENLGGSTTWEIPKTPAGITPPELPGLVPFSAGEWRSLYEIASSQYGSQAQWWRPLSQSDFRPTVEGRLGEWFARWAGRYTVERRAITDPLRRFEAALVLTGQRWGGSHDLRLWVRARCQGQVEASLIQWALAELQAYPRLPIRMEIGTQHSAAAQVLTDYGFRDTLTLLTMRYKLTAV